MPMIEVADLRKVYGERTVVDGVNFTKSALTSLGRHQQRAANGYLSWNDQVRPIICGLLPPRSPRCAG